MEAMLRSTMAKADGEQGSQSSVWGLVSVWCLAVTPGEAPVELGAGLG